MSYAKVDCSQFKSRRLKVKFELPLSNTANIAVLLKFVLTNVKFELALSAILNDRHFSN